MRVDGCAMEVIRPGHSAPRRRQGLILDADDTLWVTEWLYDQAIQEMRLIVESTGLDGEAWQADFRRRDIDNVKRFGFGSGRFHTSAVAAYASLCEASGQAVDSKVVGQLAAAAQAVFRRRAPLVPGAVDLLREARQDFVLIILTKGDPAVQRRRLLNSGLAHLVDGIVIVPDKSEQTFRDVCAEFGLAPEDCWSVGNSRASDVDPAVRAGLRGIWFPGHTWENEWRQVNPDTTGIKIVQALSEVMGVIRQTVTGPQQYRPHGRRSGPELAA